MSVGYIRVPFVSGSAVVAREFVIKKRVKMVLPSVARGYLARRWVMRLSGRVAGPDGERSEEEGV